MHPEMFLLAERLVLAMEKMSDDVKNISIYVYDLSCSVSQFLNERSEKEGLSHRQSDERDIVRTGTPAVGQEDSSLQYEQPDESPVLHIDDHEHEELAIRDGASMSIENSEVLPSRSQQMLTDRIKKEPSEDDEIDDEIDVYNLYGEDTNNMRDLQYPEPYVAASCSPADGSAGHEGAPDRRLSEGYEEEQAPGLSQTDRREGESSPSNEISHHERDTDESVSLRSSSEDSESEGRRRASPTCRKPYPSKSESIIHTRVHTDEKTYKCSQCEKVFRRSSDLTKHLRTHTGETPYKCSQCTKSFRNRGNLARHMRIHRSERSYKCSQCEKAFHKSSNLMEHMRTHTGERSYKCSQCEKSFRDNSDLRKHMGTHVGERPYKCRHCEKAFHKSSNLMEHMRTHGAERPFKCNQCEKSFRDGSDLMKHLATHMDERPYRCRKCAKEFHKSSNLMEHMRTHEGERPYKCNQCEKSFYKSSNLMEHRRTHTGGRSYKCSKCEKSFRDSSDLMKHMRLHMGSRPY